MAQLSGTSLMPLSVWRHGRRMSAVLVGALMATMLHAVVAGAEPAWAAPVAPTGPAVHGVTKAATHFDPPKDTSAAYKATSTDWPTSMSGDADLNVPASGAKQAGAVRAGATPVTAAPLAGVDGVYRGPRRLHVEVAGRDAATRLGIDGVVLWATAQDGARGDVRVSLGYGPFAQAYGGNYGSRLRLVELPACALSTPAAAECRTMTPLPSANDPVTQTLSATVTATGPGTAMSAASVTPMVLAATAGTDPGQEGGSAGTYGATSLTPAGTWASGSSTGGFSYTLPVVVPPAQTELVPTVALSYDSSAIDGRTSATAAQSSWVGDGWDTPDSYRRLPSGAGPAVK